MKDYKKEKESVGNNLKMYLRQKEMSRAELASAVGISVTALNNYIAGKQAMSIGVAANIAEALGITMEELCAENYTMRIRCKVYNALEARDNGFSTCLPLWVTEYNTGDEAPLIVNFVKLMCNGANLVEFEEVKDDD